MQWEDYYAYAIEPLIGECIGGLIDTCNSSIIQNSGLVLNEVKKRQLARIMVAQLLRGQVA